MASILQGSLARTIASAVSGIFIDATLARDVPEPSADAFDPVPPTQATYSCKAIVEGYSDRLRLDGLVQANERKVLITATSLSVTPAPGDRVTVSGVTFSVIDVETDPATAIWTCRGRM